MAVFSRQGEHRDCLTRHVCVPSSYPLFIRRATNLLQTEASDYGEEYGKNLAILVSAFARWGMPYDPLMDAVEAALLDTGMVARYVHGGRGVHGGQRSPAWWGPHPVRYQ